MKGMSVGFSQCGVAQALAARPCRARCTILQILLWVHMDLSFLKYQNQWSLMHTEDS